MNAVLKTHLRTQFGPKCVPGHSVKAVHTYPITNDISKVTCKICKPDAPLVVALNTELIGWQALASYLGVCKDVAKRAVRYRGCPPGKNIINGRLYKIWNKQEVDTWRAKNETRI